MPDGTVKQWDEASRQGLIEGLDGQSYFLRDSSLEPRLSETVEVGQRVQFDVTHDDVKGPEAVKVNAL
jgi:cold shock CspA family protein